MYDGGTGKRAVLSRWARIWAHGRQKLPTLVICLILRCYHRTSLSHVYYYISIYGYLNTANLVRSSRVWCELTTCEGKYFRIGLSLSISGGANMGLCI